MTQLSLRQRIAPPVRLRGGRTGERSIPRERQALPVEWAIAKAIVGLLALLLLALAIEVGVVGAVRHARAQALAYDQLRTALANGTAPVGALDLNGAVVAPGTPIARLQIKALGIDDVILQGTTSQVLADGPGHLRNTPFPGQSGTSVIFGRHTGYGGDFSDIGSLKPGDAITVTTGQGRQNFVVTDLRRAGTHVPSMIQGTAMLTLVTADGLPFLPQRLLYVDAHLVGNAAPTPAMPFGPTSLPADEGAMQGDGSGAIQLFLWSELLLALAIGLVWLRSRWAPWQTWIVAVPVLGLASMQTAHYLALNLPNLL